MPSDATTPPEPAATFVAPYATDEEALAAAEEAYAEYLHISDLILQEAGADAERIAAVATGEFAQISIDGYEAIAADGSHSTGATTFDSMTLQRYSATGGNKEIISVYLCHDVSDVDLLDKNGKSLVPSDRRDRVQFEASFDFDPASERLSISQRAVWADPEC
ncbi:hypothetical protein [Salinibacterium sp. NYA9b]